MLLGNYVSVLYIKRNMVSSKATRGWKIGISVILRLAALGWPGMTYVVLSGYGMILADYARSVYLRSFIVYLFIVILVLFMLVVVPCFKNRVSIATIVILDTLSLIGNIIIAIYASYHWDSQQNIAAVVPGAIYHVLYLIILFIWSAIPVIRQSGVSGLFKTRKFLYGCLFIAEPEKDDSLNPDQVSQTTEDGDFEMNDMYPKSDFL